MGQGEESGGGKIETILLKQQLKKIIKIKYKKTNKYIIEKCK